jgi:hypothetical protein
VAGKALEDFVFAAEKGGLLHLRNLRHTAASPTVASGANVKVVQTIAGSSAGDPDPRPVRPPPD